MKKPNGYKGMIRDRCPLLVNFALKWCKAKDLWINHVYKSFVGIAKDNAVRKELTRTVLGLNKKNRHFEFHDTIDWDNLSDNASRYWDWVEGWVKWFRTRYAFIYNAYDIHKTTGNYNYDSFKQELINNYLGNVDLKVREKLAEYCIKCCDEQYEL